jgi:osmotically-inducible protein OsmY
MGAVRVSSQILGIGADSGFTGGPEDGSLSSRAGRRFGKKAFLAGALCLSCLALPGLASGSPEAPEDAELRTRIEAKLAELPGREGAEVRVVVRDGQVLLQGRVRVLEQSLRAEQVAWKTSGVLDVDNELRVATRGVGGDAEIEQRVRMIIKGDERFVDTSLKLEVKAGFVTLRGLFEDPGDVLALKHRIASIPGVLDIEIEAVLVAHRVMPDCTRGYALGLPRLDRSLS